MGLFLRFVIFIYISSSHADEFFIRVIYYLCSFMTSYQMSNKRRNSQLPIACSEGLATGVIFSVFFRREKASAKKAWSARHTHAMRKGKQRTTGASYRWLYTFKLPGILFCNTPWVLCLTNSSINSVALCCSINNMIMELSGVRCGL